MDIVEFRAIGWSVRHENGFFAPVIVDYPSEWRGDPGEKRVNNGKSIAPITQKQDVAMDKMSAMDEMNSREAPAQLCHASFPLMVPVDHNDRLSEGSKGLKRPGKVSLEDGDVPAAHQHIRIVLFAERRDELERFLRAVGVGE